jgi:hypothetical protein
MTIVYADGVAWPALSVANQCVQVWEQFLVANGLLQVDPRGPKGK